MLAKHAAALLAALLMVLGLQVVVLPTQADAATVTETTGGPTNTWTNYTNAGGTQGPTIPAFTSVQIACRLTGFAVADGNTWWYQIGSAPWNSVYYASADAFYNNGATSGSLLGTPFVDTNVPICGSGGGLSETTGGTANTWSNYTNAGGTQGPTIGSHVTVTIACKITGFRVADGNTWWYLVSSSPWNSQFYVSADAFYNNGATSGSLVGTPYVDPAVPDCGGSGSGGGGGGGTTTYGETVGGDSHTWTDYSNAGGTAGPIIPSHTTVQIACKVTGFKVQDGNTWWYLVASSPWNSQYYVSADAFYNNGATSGSLIGTPYVDPAVPDCTTGTRPSGETAGPGGAGTFTDYTNAGGLLGPRVAPGQTVQVTCRLTGFAVADSDSWWYLVSSPPWSNVYFTPADPFYNNGATSGGLTGTPFVDTSVPICQGIHVAPVPGTAYAVSSSSTNRANCISGDPVDCASGDFFDVTPDIAVGGRGPGLALTRTYNDLRGATKGIFGNGWSSSYDQNLVVSSRDSSVTITLGDGSQVVAQSTGSGTYAVPAYANSTLRQNGDGTFTFVEHVVTTYTFSSAGVLLSISDPNGYSTTLSYSGGVLSSVKDSSGRTITLSFGANGLVASATDPLGRRTNYAYSAAGDLTSATDPAGLVTSYSYDGQHQMLTKTNPRGGVVTNTYDSTGRVLTQKDAAGLTNTYAYTGDNFSSLGGTTTITDAHGVKEVQQYENGFLNRLTKAYGASEAATWLFTYDQTTFGLTSTTDPDGHVTSATYNSAGDRLTTTDALGNTSTTTYNSFNEPLTTTSPLGHLTASHYDASGNLTSTVDPLGNTTTLTYGDVSHPGDKTSSTDTDGRTVQYTYSASGDVATKTTSPASGQTRTTHFTYNADGEPVCLTPPIAVASGTVCGDSGSTATPGTAVTTFDADGRPLTVTDPLGNKTTYAYDANGNQTRVQDAGGHVTTHSYDPDDRLTSTTSGADGSSPSTAQNSYDLLPGSGSCPSAAGVVFCNTSSNANGQVTTAAYDALGLKIIGIRPGGRTTTFHYDLAGNLLSQVDPGGHTATFTYDADNRRTSASYSESSTHSVSYVYNADGQRTSIADGTGTSTTVYDVAGRVTSQTNGAGAKVSYSYDGVGQVTSITYPGNHTVTRTYDGAAQLQSVTDWLGNVTTFGYDADGNLTSTAYPNGDIVTQTYDANDQPVSMTAKGGTNALLGMSYNRDSDGRLTHEVDSGALAGNVTYTYDAQGRLTGENGTTYGYDGDGNLTSAGAAAQTVNIEDQVVGRTSAAGVTAAFAYDSVGDRTAATPAAGMTYTFGYDQLGHMTSATATPGAPPVVNAVSASTGAVSGGDHITLTGSGFADATAVTFGSTAAASFTVVSDTKINVVTPADAPSTQDIVVTTPSGTSGTSSSDQFTFVPPVPTITSISPASGPSTGHTAVTVTGSGFTYSSGVTFGAVGALDYTVKSDSTLVATAPAQAISKQDVRVATSTGTSPIVTGDVFSYVKPPAPTVTSASPSSGTTGGGTAVTVRGTGFWGATKVSFGLSVATSVTVLSDTTLVAATPKYAVGKVNITVTTPGGTSAGNSAATFTFVTPPKPLVSAVSPNSGPTTGGTLVTLTGANLQQASSVTVDGTATKNFSVVSGTEITLTTAAHAATTGHITVTTPGGTSAAGTGNAFTYVAPPKPAITGLAPTVGTTAGGTSVTISGTALMGATKVTFGGYAATSFTVASETQIVAVAPKHIAGSVAVAVTTPAGVSAAVAADKYTYSSTAPAAQVADTSSSPQGVNSNIAYQGRPVVSASQSSPGTVAAPVTATYAYDGDGLRMSESVGAATASYTWDLSSASVPRILYDSTNYYIYGPSGAPIEQIAASGSSYFVTDNAGTTRALLSASGAVASTFSYNAYGSLSQATGSLRTPLMYAGSYSDSVSGLQYMVNRSYDATTGQFTTVDPAVGVTGDPYSYASDPVNNVDPSGLMKWGLITRHWRGLAQTGVALAGLGCIAASAGVATVACAAIAGEIEGMVDYSTAGDNGPHTASGLFIHGLIGGVIGAVGGGIDNKFAERPLAKFLAGVAYESTTKVVQSSIEDPGGAGGDSVPSGSTFTVSTQYVCISLQQSSAGATHYLQPTITTQQLQPASSAPVQQSSNNAAQYLQPSISGSMLQGSGSGGRIFLR